MQTLVLYRVPRVDKDVDFTCGDSLCAFMSVKSVHRRDASFNVSSAVTATALKSDERRLFWLRLRAVEFPTLPDASTSRHNTSEASSKTSTPVALRLSLPNTAEDAPENSPKSSEVSLSRPPFVHWTFSGDRLDAGRWENFESSSSTRISLILSALRRFGGFSSLQKSGCDAQRPGKNATIRSWRLKKTNSPLCVSACHQWPDDFLRRVWPLGDPSSGRPKLAADQKPKSAACNLHSQAWSSPLAGFLRCSCRQAVGIYPKTEAFSRVFTGAEADAETLSALPTHTLDPGQFFSTWHTGSFNGVLLATRQCTDTRLQLFQHARRARLLLLCGPRSLRAWLCRRACVVVVHCAFMRCIRNSMARNGAMLVGCARARAIA